MVDARMRDPAHNDPDKAWDDGGPTRLLLAFVDSHVESLARGGAAPSGDLDRSGGRLLSSWGGAAGTAGIYLNTVLHMFNRGAAWDARLLSRILFILQEDVDLSHRAIRSLEPMERHLWFWKVFLGAAALAEARGVRESSSAAASPQSSSSSWSSQGSTPSSHGGMRDEFAKLAGWYDERVGWWSRITSCAEWTEAKKSLDQIVWPGWLTAKDDSFFAYVWYNAIGVAQVQF